MDETIKQEPLSREKLDQVLRAAVKRGASDVHIKAGERPLMRVKGLLHGLNLPELTPEDTAHLFENLRPEHLKAVTVETLRELDFSFSVKGVGRFRVNAFRQRGSIALIIRVIPNNVPEFKDLNLPTVLETLADKSRGMILITGAMGSGKSTTLASIINKINTTRTAHIITIEDPIEFLFPNEKSSIVQRELGIDTASFSHALRAALRQDPNVIMIGEMRDTETIDIALKAAETGHLVFSTVHTTDAAMTINRLLSAFPMSEQAMVRMRLAESLRAIVSQRLLPRADGTGLLPAVEVMVATRVIQDCIRNADRTYELSEFIGKGKHYGMQTFDQALLRMLAKKLITKETAMAAASSPADLLLQMSLGITEEEEMSIERHNYSEMPEVMDLEMDALDELPEPSSSEPDPEPESD